MIYYAITQKWTTVTRYVPERDYKAIYERVWDITDGNHYEAANAQGWCEVASIGETYEREQFVIEIIED